MDASLSLQKESIAALQAAAAMIALVAKRVYDLPPAGAAFPYVSLGDGQILPDRADCYDGEVHFLKFDVWSREPGFVEAKWIGAAIKSTLHGAALALDGHRLVELAFESADYLRDPDGLTSHGVIVLKAQTEPIG